VNDLTQDELRAIKVRWQAATPGPWRSFAEGRDHTSGSSFIQTTGDDVELLGGTVADQDFIAHAKEDIPRLIAVIKQMRGWK
jgi:hypothetical protein